MILRIIKLLKISATGKIIEPPIHSFDGAKIPNHCLTRQAEKVDRQLTTEPKYDKSKISETAQTWNGK